MVKVMVWVTTPPPLGFINDTPILAKQFRRKPGLPPPFARAVTNGAESLVKLFTLPSTRMRCSSLLEQKQFPLPLHWPQAYAQYTVTPTLLGSASGCEKL